MKNIFKAYFTKLKYYIKNTGFLLRLIWNNSKLFIIFNVFISILNGLIPIITLTISGAIITKVEQSYSVEVSIPIALLLLLFGISLITYLMLILNNFFASANSEKVSMDVELRILNKMKDIDIINFDSSDFNELYSKVRNGINSNPAEIIYNLFEIIKNLITLASLLITFFVLPIGIIKYFILFIAVIAALPKRFFVNRQNKYRFKHQEEMNLKRRKTNYFRDVLFNSNVLDEMKMYNSADMFLNMFLTNSDELFNKEKDLEYKLHILNRLASVASLLIEKIPYVIVLYMTYNLKISLGNFIVLSGAITQMTQSMIAILFNIEDIINNARYIDYLIKFLNIPIKIKNRSDNLIKFDFNNGKHKIEFKNVVFRYPGMEAPVLNGINFIINPGDTVAFVGENGCGKSTIIKLLTRLYEPDDGEILIDDIPLSDYDPNSLYSCFGVVFQDFCRYSLSLKDCIRLGNLSEPFDQTRAEYAINKTKLTNVVNKLKNKYDTELTKMFDSEAVELSTGQWQKLSRTRCFYRNSEILVMDEPSASLDIETEYKIFQDLEQLKGEKTAIFVSHNLSSVTICNNIILISNGIVAAFGTHTELMKKKYRV